MIPHLSPWDQAQQNPTYRRGALSDDEGAGIRWHSPAQPRSSQVFCISAFGTLRSLPDRDELLAEIVREVLGPERAGGPWQLVPEYSRAELLGETGQGTPTSVDIFCESPGAVVCIESKFLYDAREGFGGCSQAARGYCAGFHGEGSDLKRSSSALCRLEIAEGKRNPRRYWEIGRQYFQSSVFPSQSPAERCPFADSSFQLMRNFLLAARAAGEDRAFGVLCLAPEAEISVLRTQAEEFCSTVLREEICTRVQVASYDSLVQMLSQSAHEESRALGHFLSERIATLQ